MPIPPEIVKEIEANMARQRLQTSLELLRDGKFTLELVRASDEPGEFTEAFQEELRHFGQSLDDARIPYNQTRMVMDSVGGGCFPLPEYIIEINKLVPPVISGLTVCVVAWIHARSGRKARLLVGKEEVEAEGRDHAEIEALLKTAMAYRDREKASDPEKDSDPSGQP